MRVLFENRKRSSCHRVTKKDNLPHTRLIPGGPVLRLKPSRPKSPGYPPGMRFVARPVKSWESQSQCYLLLSPLPLLRDESSDPPRFLTKSPELRYSRRQMHI